MLAVPTRAAAIVAGLDGPGAESLIRELVYDALTELSHHTA
jgi:hypothetical protein